LKGKLFDQGPQKYNHRIALYGMGGIGKTHTALEYVYISRECYESIYWITAVDQVSLLSGYQAIAIKAGLKNLFNLKYVEIAEGVLSWLNQERSWLLVIDNLDDINIAAGFLPQNSPQKHTLITTRESNLAEISAEGLEVPLLDFTDSVDLLATLSNIVINADSPDGVQASQIVHELGYLPLTIEQGAAYIRQNAGGLAALFNDYHKNQGCVHEWISPRNGTYPRSFATIWFMSFNRIRKIDPQATTLFQLLSFLNPDGIRINFLQSGVVALPNDLRQVVSSRVGLSKALIELENFSLLRWNRRTKTLVIHRVVQAATRDEMSEEERMGLGTIVIALCDESFPKEWNDDTRMVCRSYFDQVLIPLRRTKIVQSIKSADVMARIGDFLQRDGKYNESENVLREVVEIRTVLRGADDLSTLGSMHNLAVMYQHQGNLTEAINIHEKVLAKCLLILGDEHPSTLASMRKLAWTYEQQGKLTEAAKLHQEIVAKRRALVGDDHLSTIATMHSP
jgi:hypothetical protein